MKTNWPSTIEQPADETLLRIANEYTAHMRAILEARTPPTFQTFFKQLQEFERAMPDSLMRGANALTEDQTLAVVTMCQRFRIVQIENHLKASIDLSRHTR